MRERVRQLWLEEGEEEPGGGSGFTAALRGWWEREAVQAYPGRLALQAALAAALLAAGVLLRFLPVPAFWPAREAVRRLVTDHYTVTMAWADLRAWAQAGGGWSRAVGQLVLRWRRGVQEWVLLARGTPAGDGRAVAGGPVPAATVPGSGGTAARPAGGDGAAGGDTPPPAGRGALDRPGAGGGGPESLPADGGPPAENRPAAGLIVLGASQLPARGTGAGGVSPVAGQAVLSPFGWRERRGADGPEYHEAVDLTAQKGDEVRALRAGRVTAVGTDPLYGRFVTLDHGDGLTSRYAPLGQVEVREGETVAAGQVLGTLGDAPPGEPGAPHLHLEVLMNGVRVDPVPFLGGEGGI